MGLFSKIKGILFEDDEEGEMPVYTKEENVKKERFEESNRNQATPSVEVPSEPSEVRFKAPRAEMEYRDDILDEVAKKDELEMPKPAKSTEPVVKETPSPFLSFDEEEFERLNSHIVVNDKPSRSNSDVSTRKDDYSEFQRKANGNISATTPTRDNKKYNPDRYKIDENVSKKPFKPSPVISPVYGILDKNYKIDDIVDKKDGIKREIVKVPVREEITAYKNVEEEKPEREVLSIDSVRNKAFGAIDELERTATLKIEEAKEERKQIVEIPIMTEDTSKEEVDDFDKLENEESTHNSLDDLVSQHFDSVEADELDEDEETVPRALDDVEKTTTLQILDDIEKELNSIKPVKKEDETLEDEDVSSKEDDSLENDLFNLIDSMYEKGEEEEDD